MKPGPKRKPGGRHPSGKRTLSQRQEDIIGTAVEARVRIFNVPWDIAKSDAMGSPLQRLLHWGHITQPQADAGHNFAEVMREYFSTGKMNHGAPIKANFVPGQFDNGDGPECKSQARAQAYMRALREIDRGDPYSAPGTAATVFRVCYEQDDITGDRAMGALRVGLNAIHRIMYGRKAA